MPITEHGTRYQRGNVPLELQLWIGVFFLPLMAMVMYFGELAIYDQQVQHYARHVAWTKALETSKHDTGGTNAQPPWASVSNRKADLQVSVSTQPPENTTELNQSLQGQGSTGGGGGGAGALQGILDFIGDTLSSMLGEYNQAEVKITYRTTINLPHGYLPDSMKPQSQALHLVKRTEFDILGYPEDHEYPGHWEYLKDTILGAIGFSM